VPEKNSQIELCTVDKGFGGRQYQKTTLASNPPTTGSLKVKSTTALGIPLNELSKSMILNSMSN
jgi:hypothetical protein